MCKDQECCGGLPADGASVRRVGPLIPSPRCRQGVVSSIFPVLPDAGLAVVEASMAEWGQEQLVIEIEVILPAFHAQKDLANESDAFEVLGVDGHFGLDS